MTKPVRPRSEIGSVKIGMTPITGGTTMSDFFDRENDAKYDKAYKETTPDILKAFGGFNDAVFAEEGREIPLKYR